MDTLPRLPHAILDAPSRMHKAMKMERLIGEDKLRKASRILEPGTGSGVIADYLSRKYTNARLSATDVTDSRVAHGDYDFVLVDGVDLPFPDDYFDIVISNHVLEHVGDKHAQLHHLREIRRVLRPDGIVYFAIPNRWSPMEPHYRLPLLSWPPPFLRHAYVRWSKRGTHYDCEPRGMFELRAMCNAAGFEYRDATLPGLQAMLDIERPARVPDWVVRLAKFLAAPFLPLIPTFIFFLRRHTK